MNFDLIYKLSQFRDEQSDLFDDRTGERYSTPIGKETGEMMLQLINEFEAEIKRTELLLRWDSAVVDLNRNKGMFKAINVRLRNCSLHYNESINSYYIKHNYVSYSLGDIKDIR